MLKESVRSLLDTFSSPLTTSEIRQNSKFSMGRPVSIIATRHGWCSASASRMETETGRRSANGPSDSIAGGERRMAASAWCGAADLDGVKRWMRLVTVSAAPSDVNDDACVWSDASRCKMRRVLRPTDRATGSQGAPDAMCRCVQDRRERRTGSRGRACLFDVCAPPYLHF